MPSKKELESLRRALGDLDKQLDAELEDAVQATEKAIQQGKDIVGIDEESDDTESK